MIRANSGFTRRISASPTTCPILSKRRNDCKPNTNIAAFYDSNYRCIVYQTTSTGPDNEEEEGTNEIKTVNVDRSTPDVVEQADKVIDTQICKSAAVYAKSNGLDHIYPTDKKNKVYRSWAEITKNGGISFNQFRPLQNVLSLAPHATMAVVADAKNTKFSIKTTV
ncbi:hypothetical protein QBC46DRAFT_41693 [Diplogelasinospora grovesii]|uniref:Uncharacterized protein n=1 Tax=Diplogelasinospora grovesii TaxID=303347 RepID=A0AAN6S0T0_9PEZI|nr:hypothetical protein QBC46DRAFT_41693 [Diplogelasinospora grovesii]